LALEFARENREVMLNVVKRHLLKIIPSIEFKNEVNAHHNYAAKEYHYGKNVWVHRKGAIRAREGETGIIPGAMGSYSYIVKGKGNPESFNSCSHGAGRKLGRRQAKKQFSVEKTIADLREKGVILGKDNKRDVSEESRFAYKDIDFVIGQELDLIEPIKKLKTIAVIKG
jgi:tRNA-splicing ligase RtcB